MDPFVIVSFGTSTFRTRAIRHDLNPVWKEKLFFYVRRNECKYKLKFAVYDKDKLSGNDYVAWKEIPIEDIMMQQQQQDNRDTLLPSTGMKATAIEDNMDVHTVDLEMVNRARWQDRHPTLTFRAKFIPSEVMHKMFWVALAKAYGIDDHEAITRLEIQSMLESVGSTMSEKTINSFWEYYGKDPETDVLTMDELVDRLESFMMSSDNNDHPLDTAAHGDSSLLVDPSDLSSDAEAEEEDLLGSNSDNNDMDELDDGSISDDESCSSLDEEEDVLLPYGSSTGTSSGVSDEVDLDDVLIDARGVQYCGQPPEAGTPKVMPIDHRAPPEKPVLSNNNSNEKVIRLKECPICHRPNLSRRAQMDIVTHVATCAANDWTTVDRFLMGNFVTEAYAQRRFVSAIYMVVHVWIIDL